MKVSTGQVLFSTKLFISSMLSYVVAVQIGLTQPYWAIATCCVCMNPMTGTIRSKGVFRLAGTVSAGFVSLALAAVFGSTPILLVVVAGLAASLAFGISFLDRTPRSYGFQLFAITLMLVAVAGVDHPESMFNTAVTRVTEIGLGIVATTMVDGVLWPRSLMASLPSSMHRWLRSIERWADDVFTGHEADAQSGHDRLKLLTDISSLSQLTASLRYDPGIDRRTMQYAFAIQRRLLAMIPVLAAISDRITALGTGERIALQPYLAEALAHFADGTRFPADTADRVRHLPSATLQLRPWNALMHSALSEMLTELLIMWSEIRHFDAALRDKRAVDNRFVSRVGGEAAATLTPDFGHAARMAAGIAVSYALLCTLWLITGWSQGANAVVLGTVGLGFFGAGDEPGKAISMFGRFTALAFCVAFIVSYWLLPLATDFPTFAMAMGACMLPLGVWAAVNPMATLLLALTVSNLNLQGSYAPLDFGTFLDGTVATLIGIYIAFLGASLFRRWGAAHQIERFLRIESEDMARISRSATLRRQRKYTSRALDRLAVMTARLASTGQIQRSAQLLARVGVGMDAATLRIAMSTQLPEAREKIEGVLAVLRVGADTGAVPPQLLASIDAALDTLWSIGPAPRQARTMRVLNALAGLRLGLFGRAPAWVPT